jgi:hypothetical protein
MGAVILGEVELSSALRHSKAFGLRSKAAEPLCDAP